MAAIMMGGEGEEHDALGFEEFERVFRAERSSTRTPEERARIRAFQEFFRTLDARHFSADELLFLGGSHHGSGPCAGKNRIPDEALWPNVAPLVKALDAVREQVGRPIRLTNVYRDGPYNTCIGGVPTSQHSLFRAADIVASGIDTTACADCVKAVRAQNVFSGGIGRYKSFVHIDVRGHNADWKGAGV
jgi:hypothetical protein